MQRNLNCLFRSIRSQSQGVVSFFTSLNVRKRRGKIKYMSLQMPYTRRVRDRYDVGTMDMSRSTIRKKQQESQMIKCKLNTRTRTNYDISKMPAPKNSFFKAKKDGITRWGYVVSTIKMSYARTEWASVLQRRSNMKKAHL